MKPPSVEARDTASALAIWMALSWMIRSIFDFGFWSFCVVAFVLVWTTPWLSDIVGRWYFDRFDRQQ